MSSPLRTLAPYLGLGTLLLFTACSTTGDAGACAGIDLEAGLCLVFEDDDLPPARQHLTEQTIRQTLGTIQDLMPIRDVQIRVISDARQTIPEIGLGGYAPSADEIRLFIDPALSDLDAVIQADLPLQLAHELHHARRRQTVGYGSTLLEAAVSEGLADHFAVDVTGDPPPPWSRALTGDVLDTWMVRAQEVFDTRPYDHGVWFYGADGTVPRWAGYAIGYALVERHLATDPTRPAATLVDEPAATFRP